MAEDDRFVRMLANHGELNRVRILAPSPVDPGNDLAVTGMGQCEGIGSAHVGLPTKPPALRSQGASPIHAALADPKRWRPGPAPRPLEDS